MQGPREAGAGAVVSGRQTRQQLEALLQRKKMLELKLAPAMDQGPLQVTLNEPGAGFLAHHVAAVHSLSPAQVCDPMDGTAAHQAPLFHCLPGFAQTHVQ